MVDRPAPQRTARFHGGSLDGQERVVPDEPRPYLEVPVYDQTPAAFWSSADSALTMPVSLRTETYVAHRVYNQTNIAAANSANLWHQSFQNFTTSIEYFSTALTATQAAMEQYRGGWLTANEARQLIGFPNYTTGANAVYQMSVDAPPLTDAELARRALQARRTARRKQMAHKRARQLLLNLLTDEQQREYASSKAFTVHARNGKVFRLRKGKTHELLGSDGVPVAAYCVHLAYGYAEEDTLAALLLTLQNDPAEFERVANVTQLQRRRTQPPSMADDLARARLDAQRRAEYVRESRQLLASEGLSEAEIDALQEWPNRRNGLLVVGAAA